MQEWRLEYKAAKEALEHSAKVLETMNVIWFIDLGTLLGAVRDKGFIKDDHDVDLGFFLGQYQRDEVLDILLGAGFSIEWLLQTGDGLSPQYAMVYKGVRVDFSVYCHDLLLNKVWHYSYMPMVSWARNVLPDYMFKVMDTVKFAGRSYPAPSPVKDYLKLRYGNWQVPQKKWDYMRDPPCVTEWGSWWEAPQSLIPQGKG